MLFCCLNSSVQKIETCVTLLPQSSVQLFICHLLTSYCYAFGCETYHWCLPFITLLIVATVPPDLLLSQWQPNHSTAHLATGSEVHMCPSLPRLHHHELIRDHEWISICWGSEGFTDWEWFPLPFPVTPQMWNYSALGKKEACVLPTCCILFLEWYLKYWKELPGSNVDCNVKHISSRGA